MIAPLWFSQLSSQMIMAGSFDSSISNSRKLPIPCLENMRIWSCSTFPLASLAYPVAKMPCQNSATFSRSGASVEIMRYIQLAPAPMPIIPMWSG